MRLRRPAAVASSVIPTASMADIAFLLIIFFLVASFYSVTRGIQFSLPKHEPEAFVVEPEASVLIEVAADASLMVDRAPMALDRLQPYLRERLAQNPAKPKPEMKRIPRPDPTPAEPEPPSEPAPVPPQAPPAEAPPAQSGPMRVAPGQGPGLIKRVEPIYPAAMQAARREGVVELDAVIYKDGTVGEVKVLSSPNPLFAQESVRAVQQWRFTPFPTDVILTVTVRFTLRK